MDAVFPDFTDAALRAALPAAALVPAALSSPVPSPVSPDALPGVWRASELGRDAARAVSTGFGLLDEQLPAGGWPHRGLTELLLPHAGIGEVRLMAHALAQVQQAGRLVMLFDPPEAVCASALVALGIDVDQLLVVNTQLQPQAGTDRLWALEQSLKSGHVGAAVAWLPPRLRAERLRRLQLAATAHDGPAFVLREAAAQGHASAAPLRLSLHPAGADQLALRVLKRRGPPLLTPLHLALPPVLSPRAARRAQSNEPLQPLRAAAFINLA